MNNSVACIGFTGIYLFVSLEAQAHTRAKMHTLSVTPLPIFLTISRNAENLGNSKRIDCKEEATGCNNIFSEYFLLGK